jgi:hypothetical protein
MRVKLHIGLHKCGSTAVQVGMARSRSALAANGVIYPAAHCWIDGHHLLSWALAGDARSELTPEQLLDAWFAEAAGQKAEIMVLSSEEFEFLTAPEIGPLRALLDGHEVAIFVYVRPQDEYLIAEYKQFVRMADTAFSGSIEDFYNKYRPQLNQRFDYYEVLQRWVGHFGAECINVTSYHRASLVGGDVLADFVDAAGLPAFDLPDDRDQNVSWSDLTTRLIAKLNGAGISGGKREEIARQLEQIVNQCGLEADLLDAGARTALLSSCRPGNRKLLAEFPVRGDAGRLVERRLASGKRHDPDAAMVAALIRYVADSQL